MKDRFKHHQMSAAQRDQLLPFRNAFAALCEMIETLPGSRCRSLAVTELEEAFMWVERGILLGDGCDGA